MSEPVNPQEKDLLRERAVAQGYVPKTCTLPGTLVFLLTSKEIDPCKGCNENRSVCKGRPK